jgi:hypothetical protein
VTETKSKEQDSNGNKLERARLWLICQKAKIWEYDRTQLRATADARAVEKFLRQGSRSQPDLNRLYYSVISLLLWCSLKTRFAVSQP